MDMSDAKDRNSLIFHVTAHYDSSTKRTHPVAIELEVGVHNWRAPPGERRISSPWGIKLVHFRIDTNFPEFDVNNPTTIARPRKEVMKIEFFCDNPVHREAIKLIRGLHNPNWKIVTSSQPCCYHDENPFDKFICVAE